MEFLSRNANKWLFYFIIITLTISPAFATDTVDNRNYLLIGAMFLGPVIVLFSNRFFPKIDIPAAILIITIFATQFLFHSGNIRFSSILFSCMYIVYFIAAVRVYYKAEITNLEFLKIIEILIIAYAIVLIIQQICVLLGLPVFNQLWGFGSENPWKLNSLSAEPSHTARYVGLLMYAFLKIDDSIYGYNVPFRFSFQNNRITWISFLWVMLTCQSGTAFIILGILLTKYITRNSIFAISSLLAVSFIIGMSSDFKPLKRATTFFSAVLTGDTNQMINADLSASIRVVPGILCLKRIDPTSLSGWIGEGSGSISKWLWKYIPGVPRGWTGGATAGYALEYGLLVGLLLLFFSFKWCFDKENKIATIAFWIVCLVLEGINMQMAWLCITLLYLVKQSSLEYK